MACPSTLLSRKNLPWRTPHSSFVESYIQMANGMQHLPCKEPVVAAQWLTMSDHDPDSALPLGQRVKQLRAEHGWSQADLAAKIGTDAGQISRYENGRMSPSAEAVVRLA